MQEFRLLRFYTPYSCKGEWAPSYKANIRMGPRICFQLVWHNIKNTSNLSYKIIIYMGTLRSKIKHENNACLLTIEQLRNHLRQLRHIYPLHYKVTDISDSEYNKVSVSIHLKEVPALYHKYVLTWLRYTYEYPYNVLLRDTYLLKKDPQFRFVSIANLFNAVTFSNPFLTGEGHSISADTPHFFLTRKELKESIKTNIMLNDIYCRQRHYKKTYDIPQGFSFNDIEWWNEENFELYRKPVYIKTYNRLK